MKAKAKLAQSEVAKAISNRTGLPISTVKVIIETYTDIVKEALLGQVEVPLGNLCTFSWSQINPKNNYTNWDYRIQAMAEPHTIDGYQKMTIRVNGDWKRKLRELTSFSDGEENPMSFEKMYGLSDEMDLEENNDELQDDDDNE